MFANDELQQLVDELYTKSNFETTAPDLLGALVLAARRLPREVVIALIPAYIERARAEVDEGDGEDTPPAPLDE